MFVVSSQLRPVRGPSVAALHHHRHQSVYVLATEGRLDHPTRPPPDITITDDKAVSEQHFDTLKSRALAILTVSARQDSADFGGIVNEICQSTIGLGHADHIAELTLQSKQCRQGLRINAERHRIFGTRWKPDILLDGRHGKLDAVVSH
jgi:hypothetical protein